MQKFFATALGVTVLAAAVHSASLVGLSAEFLLDSEAYSPEQKWDVYKSTYGKVYAVEEEADAFFMFSETDKRIKEHNAKKLSWTMGHNQFSDLSPEEFKNVFASTNLMASEEEPRYNKELKNMENLADAVDWVTKGAVTEVKDQGQCGGCWAFSTTGAIEGAYFVSTGTLVSFSEQELISCDNKYHGKGVDEGCNGGLMDNAFKWLESYHGLCAEADYPYTSKNSGKTGYCIGGDHKTMNKGPNCTAVATLTGFHDVETEKDMVAALNIGPLSVAIEADKTVFQSYKSGVLDSARCGTNLDHGVLAVGYGTDAGTDYWKVKNSWGATWGEEGYIRMARGKNMCGIASGPPSYPTGVTKA